MITDSDTLSKQGNRGTSPITFAVLMVFTAGFSHAASLYRVDNRLRPIGCMFLSRSYFPW